jgi:ferrochelatase
MKTGILLINLGSPEAPTAAVVRPYLREFLSDPRVIDIPAPLRWLLLNAVILPFRPAKSAAAYAKVWTPAGSPLLAHSRAFAAELAAALGEDYRVVLAMRYGNPSVKAAVEELTREPLRELVIFPLYPQYASASTGSSLEEALRLLAPLQNVPALRTIPAFYDDPGYVRALVENAAPRLRDFNPDHVLFSYHGLPERQIRKSEYLPEHAELCLRSEDGCCADHGIDNPFCYRSHCFVTTRLIAKDLGLAAGTYSTAFQSRLGRTPWIKPYTDQVLVDLARAGVKKLAVFSPSFVADCLETLEEMTIRGAETFREAGGEELRLIPALNATPAWVAAAASLIRPKAP